MRASHQIKMFPALSGASRAITGSYRVTHLLMDLGWVDLDLEQTQIQVNPTQSARRWVTLYSTVLSNSTVYCYSAKSLIGWIFSSPKSHAITDLYRFVIAGL